MNCLECGRWVTGDVEPYHRRGFCSNECGDLWESWRLRETSRGLPGLTELFDNDGLSPTLEQLLPYITEVLGCGMWLVKGGEEWNLVATFEWRYPDHIFFGRELSQMFSGISGFILSDTENVGLRKAQIDARGSDLVELCLSVIAQAKGLRGHFVRECERWSTHHIDELESAVARYVDQSPFPIAESEAYQDFMEWLGFLSGGGELRRA